MAPSMIHLPDGQTFTVQPVFAGLFFKSHELNKHHQSPFPVGWTVVIHTEDVAVDADAMVLDSRTSDADTNASLNLEPSAMRRSNLHSFTKPTLRNDTVYISSISNPSSADFKEPVSPSRQIAMMLWVTLYWYFHQPPPSKTLPLTDNSKYTAFEGRPRGDWRINIKRDGVLRGRNLIPKLERMGLIASLDSAVGSSMDDNGEEWVNMYVSQNMFWQIPPGLFLFSPEPTRRHHGSRPGSPVTSRPSSPAKHLEKGHTNNQMSPAFHLSADVPGAPPPQSLAASPTFPVGPYYSSSHLPTYYPPPPLQYTLTNHIRHPLRPKPPRMGEVFYTRFIPSVGQYLSFRVASSSPKPVPYLGPAISDAATSEQSHLMTLCDIVLVQMWLSNPRVAKFWGGYVPNFLTSALTSRHSFPVIGMWDGVPFGYFEIYWVKEDVLGRYIDAGDWDRGIHVFIGEEWARGKVQAWMSSLVHWILYSDNRTMSVCMEPRVDNERYVDTVQTRPSKVETDTAPSGSYNTCKRGALSRRRRLPSLTSSHGSAGCEERTGRRHHCNGLCHPTRP